MANAVSALAGATSAKQLSATPIAGPAIGTDVLKTMLADAKPDVKVPR